MKILVIFMIIALVLVTGATLAVAQKTVNQLEETNIELSSQLAATSDELVELQVSLEAERDCTQQLTSKIERLEDRLFDREIWIASYQQELNDFHKGLSYWTAKYDQNMTENLDHFYGEWPNNLSDVLDIELWIISRFGPEGKMAARERFAVLKPLILSVVNDGQGWGWEESLLREREKSLY